MRAHNRYADGEWDERVTSRSFWRTLLTKCPRTASRRSRDAQTEKVSSGLVVYQRQTCGSLVKTRPAVLVSERDILTAWCLVRASTGRWMLAFVEKPLQLGFKHTGIGIAGTTGDALAQGSGSMGFSIGEVSQAVGVAPQTLRLWERERLIKQLRKVEGLNFAAIRKQLGSAPEKTSPNGPAPGGPLGAPGERLRRLRIKAHKTLKEVSEATGLSISFISALERGGS